MRRICLVRHIVALRRIRRCDRGAVAVEFSIIALPFIGMLASSLVIGLEYLVYSQIDYATHRAAQEIRAGNVQIQQLSAPDFLAKVVCPNVTMLPCASARVNAAVIARSADWAAYSSDTIDPAKARWCPGGSADAVLLQVSFPTPFATLLFGASDAVRKYYTSSVAFRNDPFGASAAGNC